MVRKPFQCISNGSAIDDSGADTAHAVPEVKAIDRLSPARPDPSQADHDRAEAQHEPWSDAIDEISFKRNKPSLQGDKQSKRPLHRNQTDMQMSLYGFGKKSPGILQVCDRHHCDDASRELDPAVGNTRWMN